MEFILIKLDMDIIINSFNLCRDYSRNWEVGLLFVRNSKDPWTNQYAWLSLKYSPNFLLRLGYEADAVPDNLIADRLDSAGYSLGLYMEDDALSALTLGCNGMDHSGTAFGSTDVRYNKKGAVVEKTLTAANVYQQIVELNQKMDENDVPMDGRYIIVTPATYALLLQDTTHFIRYGDRSQEMLETGAIGEIIGLKVYRSNVLTGKKVKVAYNSGTEDRNVEILAGHPLFATRVEAWKVEPFLKDLNGDATIIGGSAVKGRKIFVHEVTKPQAFAMIVKEHAA